MALASYYLGRIQLGDGAVPATPTGFEIFLNGSDVAASAMQGSVTIEQAINDRSSARFMLTNPTSIPLDGQVVMIRKDGVWLFGGVIDRIQLTVSTRKNHLIYDCQCVDWQGILERRIVDATYTNRDSLEIVRDVLANYLDGESIHEAFLESGAWFPLVDADNIRVSELIRDLAEGAGQSWWIDPQKGLHMVSTMYEAAPFTLEEGVVINPVLVSSRDQYRNVQIVKSIGTASTEVTETREDTTEIAARQAKEGGSGRYEIYETIEHPTSDDTVELQKLAITYAIIRLNRSGAVRRELRGSCHTFGLMAGQIATVNLPEHGAAGLWTLTRVRTQHVTGDLWRYDFEAIATSPLEVATDAYLRLLRAGRAIVQLPVGFFENVHNFAAPGVTTWPVPGSGTVELQITVYGASGGGGGYSGVTGVNGGAGGAGGKAVSFRSVAAGTVLDVTVGAKGTGGAGAGTSSTSFTSPTTTTWTVPGTGDVEVRMTVNGAGGGGGDAVNIAGGIAGKAGGNGGQGVTRLVVPAGTVFDVIVGAGGAGGIGTGSDAGEAGGLSRVSLSGVTKAQGDGGTGGGDGVTGSPGSPGTGTGDSSTTGGGASGGAGGPGGGGNNPGSPGGNGSVTFQYSDANPGTSGGLTKIEIGGVVQAQGDGGGFGDAGFNGGAAGTPGSGSGDQIFTGGGDAGGTGGTVFAVTGIDGVDGHIEIRY